MTAQNRNLRLVFFAAIIFVFILTIFSYQKITSLIQSAALVNHTTQVSLELEKVMGTLKDVETGHRGYLLTHDKAFLEAFNQRIKEYHQCIKTVKQLTLTNPEHQKNLSVVERLAGHREDYMRKMLEIDNSRKPTATELLLGKSIMDSLQAEVNIMISRENNLLEQRNKNLDRQTMIAPVMLLVLSLMALVILFISYWQLNKSLLKAQQLQKDVIDKTVLAEKNKQIEASQKELQSLIKQAPFAITLLEGENLLLKVANETALQLMGKTEEQVVNKALSEIFPELSDRQNIYKEVFKTGIPYEGKDIPVNFKRYGEDYSGYYDLNYLPWYSSEGKIKGVMGVGIDVTEKNAAYKKIEASEERFRSLAQTLPQLVWVTDALGNSEFASKRWKEYTGIEPGGEKEWNAIVHPDDLDAINAAWANSLATGELYRYDVRLKSKEGEYRWHTVNGEPVLDKENNIVKWVGAFTDIHEQKIKEEKKDEFISIASHEMKTPLTTAKAYLQMLELSLDKDNEDATLYTMKASQSVNRLNELIGELLDVSKIRLGKLNYTITTFDFNELVEGTVENIRLTTSTHAIIKTGKVSDDVTGDKDRLQQVLINLLTNAIKYSPRADKILITMEQENDLVKVSVKDTGIGIAKKSLDKIFDKYHRVEEHAEHFQGLGIGLFISYEIIQRHHGKLWAESEPGNGSTFYFTLPISYSPPSA